MKRETLGRAESLADDRHPVSSDGLARSEHPAPADEPAVRRAGGRVGSYWWVIAIAISASAMSFYLTGREERLPAPRPLIAPVKLADIENVVAAVGELQPSKYVDVGAQVSGQLESLLVAVGDHVAVGDLVGEIDATVQMNRVAASRANLDALEAQLSARESSVNLARARLERQTDMLARKATSQDDYDDAVDRLATARSSLVQLRSQIAQARAGLGSDEATLGYSKIFAPIAGTVVSIDKQEGQTLNASQTAPTIMRIADLSTMTVEAQVSEADVARLHTGMVVYFTTLGSGERRWTSRLRQVLPTPVVENNVVFYTALFDVDNADGALLMNMTAQVFFVTEAVYGVLSVPVGALSYPQGGMSGTGTAPVGSASEDASLSGNSETRADAHSMVRAATSGEDSGRTTATVKVVEQNGNTVERVVQVGISNRISAHILSGLSPGENVVAGFLDSPGRNP